MRGKFTIYNLQFIIFLSALLYIVHFTFYIPSALADTSGSCSSTGTTAIANGLVSTPELSSNFVNSSGACIIDPKAAFAPYRLPTFDDLKSLYYTQAKSSSTVNKVSPLDESSTNFGQFNSSMQRSKLDSIFFVNGNLIISNPNFSSNSKKTALIFVKGNIDVNANITYGDTDFGLVLVVEGDVNIDPSVTRIDAIIISGGTIYTAGANCSNLNPVLTSQLVINGSLISLTDATPIKFCRTLTDTSQPAEQINHQVKYLVILRDLMSDTFQRWSEIQ